MLGFGDRSAVRAAVRARQPGQPGQRGPRGRLRWPPPHCRRVPPPLLDRAHHTCGQASQTLKVKIEGQIRERSHIEGIK